MKHFRNTLHKEDKSIFPANQKPYFIFFADLDLGGTSPPKNPLNRVLS